MCLAPRRSLAVTQVLRVVREMPATPPTPLDFLAPMVELLGVGE